MELYELKKLGSDNPITETNFDSILDGINNLISEIQMKKTINNIVQLLIIICFITFEIIIIIIFEIFIAMIIIFINR